MAVTISLEGRVALITGASKNIGAATARLFAQAGADLVLVARGAGALQAVAAEIRRDTGRQVVTIIADVGSNDGIETVIREGLAAFPQVDILINNAHDTGDTVGKKVFDIEWETWARCVAVNLEGPFRLSQAFGRKMVERESGVILTVMTPAAFNTVSTLSAYGCTKAAAWHLTRYMAAELGPHVRVNAVCPGTVATEESLALLPPASQERMRMRAKDVLPLARFGRPEECAHAFLHLASDAASFTTGDILFVDGGRTSSAGSK